MTTISKVQTRDARFDLPDGAGSDSIHVDPQYGYGVTLLSTDDGLSGTGIAYTLGEGTDLVCRAIDILAEPLVGQEIEELMAHFGAFQKKLAEHSRLRWLGPHKGVIHLALASITNACFDLWAKARGVPLWKLLLDLSPEDVAELIDFSYLDEVLTKQQAVQILKDRKSGRERRGVVVDIGYPGYDTSVGWLGYDEDKIVENAKKAIGQGFKAVKLKVGAKDPDKDYRRVNAVRLAVGHGIEIMLDANQIWSLPQAIERGKRLNAYKPYWLEEPTQPDDVLAHRSIAQEIAPVPVAVGEAISNRVLWKNFLQAGAVGIVQADCTRLAGISEYLAVSILATRFPVKVVPHVGDMGQIHQHLVLFNHIALEHQKLFLEAIPHLKEHFVHPAQVKDGVYVTPQEPGCSTDLH